jgi:histidine triad (HIT) family protein
MPECVFCAIGAHRSPAEVVYEDAETIAFLDIQPVMEGHCLIVPKAHARNVFDISPESAASTMLAATRVAKAVQAVTGADGMNIWQSSEEVAGQTVFHFHIHVVPRHHGDGGIRFAGRHRADSAALRAVADRIRSAMKSMSPQG